MTRKEFQELRKRAAEVQKELAWIAVVGNPSGANAAWDLIDDLMTIITVSQEW